MKNQAQRVTIAAVVAISAICILMVVAAWWYESHKVGNNNTNIVTTKTVKIANGTVSISCKSDTDCTIVNRDRDYSECCQGPLDCSDFTQEKNNYIAVNSQSFDKLMENYKNLGDRCRDVPCNQYTAPYCPGGTSSDYMAKCSNSICKKVLKANTNINTNTNINVVCDETVCAKYRFGNCPAGCIEQCVPSNCADTPQGRVCTTDCNGPGSCTCPPSDSKYCNQDSDCGLYICLGCFSKEYLKTAPADLPCTTYDGYVCQCVKNRCLEIKPDKPYDFPSIKYETDCLALGAEWVSVGKVRRCEMKAPDAGKTCTKAGECIRSCGLEDVNSTTGTCSAHSGSGCYRYLDEDGKLGMICVD